MMKKIIGFIVCTLFISATIYPAIGFGNQDPSGFWIKLNPNEVGGNFHKQERHGMTYYESVDMKISKRGRII